MSSFSVTQTLFTTCLLLATQALCQEPDSKPCPLAGAEYPAPSQPGKSDAILKAKDSFEAQLASAFKTDTESPFGSLGYETSFSVQVYSIHEIDAIHTHHWTAPKLPVESGQKAVDSNSVFRVGSISKLISTYIYLINAGFTGWNDPITDYIPQLKEYAEKSKTNPLDAVAWDEVTVGSLASHLSGITTDGAPPPSTDAILAAAGLPKVPGVPGKFCGDAAVQEFPCDDEEFLKDVNIRHPVLQTFADSPIYSNTAWRFFTMALENITETSFSDLFKDTFVDHLGLNNTFDRLPQSDSSSYIPVNSSVSWYDVDLRSFTPGGGYWSSVNDLRKIGVSILNSTLMPSSRTRQWMKPHVFTANENSTIGAPWEIYRAPVERASWMYTKSGDLGLYSSNMILLQEYGVGITVFAAGLKSGQASQVSRILSDVATAIFVPALEQATKEESASKYAGVYGDESTNTTVTLEVRKDGPGLTVGKWILAGQDVLSLLGGLSGSETPARANLYPTGLRSTDGKQIGWRAVFSVPQPATPSIFANTCNSWFGADRIVYGGIGAGEFVVNMDKAGDGAESINFRLLGLPLPKTEGSLRKKVVSSVAV